MVSASRPPFAPDPTVVQHKRECTLRRGDVRRHQKERKHPNHCNFDPLPCQHELLAFLRPSLRRSPMLPTLLLRSRQTRLPYYHPTRARIGNGKGARDLALIGIDPVCSCKVPPSMVACLRTTATKDHSYEPENPVKLAVIYRHQAVLCRFFLRGQLHGCKDNRSVGLHRFLM